MPGPLALPSLEIHNFRGLRELKIARLGRANLIVGKNNVGKTSVLEALRIYASSPPSSGILDVLRDRDELYTVAGRNNTRLLNGFLPIKSLFFGRRFFPDKEQLAIAIGPIPPSSEILTIGAGLQIDATRPETEVNGVLSVDGVGHLTVNFGFGGRSWNLPIDDAEEFQRLDTSWRHTLGDRFVNQGRPHVWVGRLGLDSETIERLWAKVAMSDREQELVRCLQLIDPDIERVSLIPASESRRELTPFVRIRGIGEPIYVGSLGEGVVRLLGIALALLNAGHGLFLADEIESGLHYSIQQDVWRFIFDVASKYSVQVFATTHSSDCVAAFQAAASESEEDGVLIRLARKGDRILVGEYDKALLEKAVDGGVEVR